MSQKSCQGKSTKGVYKYYQVILRTKMPVSEGLLEGMKEVIWQLFSDVPKSDIISRKVSKPHNLRWRQGGYGG